MPRLFSEKRRIQDSSDAGIHQDDQKTDSVYAGDAGTLDEPRVLILAMGQQAPGQGKKGQVGTKIFQGNPDEGCRKKSDMHPPFLRR